MTSMQFGVAGDLPIPADYDGDGKTDMTIFRHSTMGWYGVNSTNGSFSARGFGLSGDIPASDTRSRDHFIWKIRNDHGLSVFLTLANHLSLGKCLIRLPLLPP